MPSSFDVKSIFEYRNGNLFWRKKPPHSKWDISKPAGTISSFGYRVICYKGWSYRSHRLVWIYFNGKVSGEIDHINRDKLDNRIENLRIVSKSENLCNVDRGKAKGIRQRGNSWSALIQKSNRRYHLGSFPTREQAIQAYNSAAIKLHGKYACLDSNI